MSRLLLKTHGIILNETRYKETSKILNVYTKNYGRISIMAQGAYRPKSPLIASTQSFSLSEFNLQKNGEFYYINGADLLDSNYGIREDMNRVFYGYYLLELINLSTPVEEENEKLFLLLQKGLQILSNLDEDYLKFIVSYELKFISFLGYRPNMSNCVICNNDENYNIRFSFVEGGIICNDCFHLDSRSVYINKDMYQSFNSLLFIPLDRLNEVIVSIDTLKELHKMMVDYILYNIDRNEFKSLNLLSSLIDL